MSATRPQPFPAPRLSRRGLILALVLMNTTMVSLVMVAYFAFPPISPEPLQVRVLTDGYASPSEVAASIAASRAGEGEILDPYLTIENTGDEAISSLFVTINKRFVFHAAEPLKPGETRDFYLAQLQEPDGSRFWPNKFEIDRVLVKARLPSLKQAVYEIMSDELFREPVPEGEGETATEGDVASDGDMAAEPSISGASDSATGESVVGEPAEREE